MYTLTPMKKKYITYATSNSYSVGIIGNKNVRQVTDCGFCREFMIPRLRDVIAKDNKIFDKRIAILKISRLVSSLGRMGKLEMNHTQKSCEKALLNHGRIYGAQVKSFYRNTKLGINLLNKIESIFDWPKSKLIHIKPVNKREDISVRVPTYLMIGIEIDKRWIMSPQLFSLLVLLIRNGSLLSASSIKNINNDLLNSYTLNLRRVIKPPMEAYCNEALRYISVLLKYYDRIFYAEKDGLHNWLLDRSLSNHEQEVLNRNNYYNFNLYRNGVSRLVCGTCDHPKISSNFNKLRTKYVEGLYKGSTNAKA